MPDFPKFSDFAVGETRLTGDKKQLSEIENVEILITGYNFQKSKFKDDNCLTLQFKIENLEFVVFTGSAVLRSQIEKYNEHIPFLTTCKNPQTVIASTMSSLGWLMHCDSYNFIKKLFIDNSSMQEMIEKSSCKLEINNPFAKFIRRNHYV